MCECDFFSPDRDIANYLLATAVRQSVRHKFSLGSDTRGASHHAKVINNNTFTATYANNPSTTASLLPRGSSGFLDI